MRIGLVLVVLSGLLFGCRTGPESEREPANVPARSVGEQPLSAGSANGAQAPDGVTPPARDGVTPPAANGSGAAAVIDEESLVGAPPPAVQLDAQVCESHEDCRVFQPGDWNARVECCYEYRCDLDYVAVNARTWDLLRAWQRANPFDCVAHLRDAGPCSTRTPRCGLVQAAPAAACIEGLCEATLPEEWPRVDPEAQRCTSNSECIAYRPASTSLEARCCGMDCSGPWVAINNATAEEIDRWKRFHAPACEPYLAENICDSMAACALVTPPVVCRGGECVVE